jgi:hypothetical protein
MPVPVRELSYFVVLYAAIYGAFGVASPFWPRFFEARGLTAEEIGLLFGLVTIVRLIVGPCAGRGADLLQALRMMLGACAIVAAGAALALLAAHERSRRSQFLRMRSQCRHYDRRAMRGRESIRHDHKTASRLAPREEPSAHGVGLRSQFLAAA